MSYKRQQRETVNYLEKTFEQYFLCWQVSGQGRMIEVFQVQRGNDIRVMLFVYNNDFESVSYYTLAEGGKL